MTEKNEWFGPCSLCGIKKDLTTISLSDKKSYTIWLKRMCEDCRNRTLFYLYTGLGFKSAAEIWRKKL